MSTSHCAACGNPTSTTMCSRCGFVAPGAPVVLAKAEEVRPAVESSLFDATVARPSATVVIPPQDVPAPSPWGEPPPGAGAAGPVWPAPSPASSTTSTIVAHLVLWAGLTVVALTLGPLASALYDSGLGFRTTSIVLGILRVLPFAIAVVIAARSGTLRIVALVGALAVTGAAGYESSQAYSNPVWPVALGSCVVGLATWIVVRRHARTGYFLLVPAALVLLLWFPSFGPGSTLQTFPYAHGVTSGALLVLWSDLPLVAMAGLGLVSSLLRPPAPSEGDRLGWALVGPLVLVSALMLPVVALGGPSVADYTGVADYSGASAAPDYTGAGVDPATAAAAYLDAAAQGQTSVAGCNGDVETPAVASYTIGQVSPATTGGFDVSATVTAPDGSVEVVTVHIGPTVGANGQACVDSVSTPDYSTSGSDQAGGTGFPVPSVPSASDPVPSGTSIPDGTVGGTVVPYTDSSQTPTTTDELVAYQPSDLTGDETAAVQALIRFLTAVNQQYFQAAWSASTYSTKSATYTSDFGGGYATTRHYEVSFGEPQVLSSTLIAVPATFVSRQDPAAQGNPAGVTDCTYWPQYVFLAAYVNGAWLDDTAGVFTSDPTVAPLKRPDPARPGKVYLNPLAQRVAC